MLQAKTEKQKEQIDRILENISVCWSNEGNGLHIDDWISFDEMAAVVDFLRSAKPKKATLDLSIVSNDMRGIVDTWLAYKKEKGQTYKPTGFKVFYKHLIEYSGNNPQIAKEIIENSMCNNYAGIFPYRGTSTPVGNHYPQSVDDIRGEDVMPTLAYFQAWLNKKCGNVWENLKGTANNGGWPRTEEQYKKLAEHTKGGVKGLCYVVLVFNRDGWDIYYDKRGFMFTYSNYIKANGLFKG